MLSPAGGLQAADKRASIEIGGNGGALGGIQEAASAYRRKHPGVVFHFAPSLGSSGGIQAVLAGVLDLGLSARPLSDEEQKQGAGAAAYARTPLIFVTSHKGRTPDLTPGMLVSMYAGEMKNWPDGSPIRLILRPAGDSDTVFLKGLSPAMDRAVQAAFAREGLVTAVTDQENADVLERIKGGLGTSTLAQVLTERRQLRPLSVNGIAPSLEALAGGSYPYYKTYYIVTGPRTNAGARAFIKFLFSPEGRAALAKSGHLPPRTR